MEGNEGNTPDTHGRADQPAHDEDILDGRIVPQHISSDDPELDDLDAASADSFPSSDPPSQSAPTTLGGERERRGR